MTSVEGGVAARAFSLTDRYELSSGRVHLTGIQTLAKVPVDKARRDRSEGRVTGIYISSHEGSPLAGYDMELVRQRDLLDEHGIFFEPGLNEEAAAMAVLGTELIGRWNHTSTASLDSGMGRCPGGIERPTLTRCSGRPGWHGIPTT